VTATMGFCWYFHLPKIASRIEVKDHAVGSLELLLSLHMDLKRRVLVAPTASFLELCERYSPRTLESLRSGIEAGIVEIALTTAYDPDPFSISHQRCLELMEWDAAAKRRLLNVAPRWFMPGNYLWVPGMERHCFALGIEGIVLDSRHYEEATSLRVWQASSTTGELQVRRQSTVLGVSETSQLSRVEYSQGKILSICWRDWPATQALTFGNLSAIHDFDAEWNVKNEWAALEVDRQLVIIADDGDRIRGKSRSGYMTLLSLETNEFDWSTHVRSNSGVMLHGLPGFIPPGLRAILHDSTDAQAYWKLLREVDPRSLSMAQFEEFLSLHDVFYAFWPDVARRKYYIEALLDFVEISMLWKGKVQN